MKSRVGQVLISHPNLPKGNPFEKSVIYIYQDNAEATLGLVLNKETSWTTEQVCHDKQISYIGPMKMLYYGGPVNQGALCLLHSDDWYSQNTVQVGNGMGLSSDDFMLEKLGSGNMPAYWRMLVGMCAWQPGQLDAELKGTYPYKPENSWLTAEANDAIVFEIDGEKQWELALRHSSQQLINQYL